MNVIDNPGLPSITTVIDQYVKSGNPFAGNALNLQSAVPQASIPTLNVGNPLAVESSTTTEETNPFKIKPKKGRLHAPLVERTGDKYIDIGNRYGNLASQAITGMYNKDIDDANAKIDADYTNYLINRQRKADEANDVNNTEFVFGDDIDDKFLNDASKILPPSEYSTLKQLNSIIGADKEFKTNTLAGKRAYAQFLKQKEKAIEAKRKLLAKYHNELNNLGGNTQGELSDSDTLKGIDKLKEVDRVANVNRNIAAAQGGKGLLDNVVHWGAALGKGVLSGNLDNELEAYRAWNNSSNIGNQMKREGYQVQTALGPKALRAELEKQPNNERLRGLIDTIAPNETLIQYRHPITKEIKLIAVGPRGTRELTNQLGAEAYNIDFTDANLNNNIMR